jgi:hypothetical protein
MTDHTDIMVATHQGLFYRPDAKKHMTDREWCEWYIEQTRGRIETKKARKERTCKICGHPIFSGLHYLAIFYGDGLGSLKFPDVIHDSLECLKDYTMKRKTKFNEQGFDPITKEYK